MWRHKKPKKYQTFWQKHSYFQAYFFLFYPVMHSSCPKKIKNAVKIEKCQFFLAHHLTGPAYKESQIDIMTNCNIVGILTC